MTVWENIVIYKLYVILYYNMDEHNMELKYELQNYLGLISKSSLTYSYIIRPKRLMLRQSNRLNIT
jgi:hypothetical protein